jgi:chromosome segregation ATPase
MAAEGDVRQVTMDNTKKEILEAYGDLVARYRRQKEQKLDAKERIQEMETSEAVAVAEGLPADQVVKQIGELKARIGSLLGEVSDRLEGEVRKFDSLRKAIAAKEERLKEIYGIEREAGTLAALVEAQKAKREEYESDWASRKAQLEEEIRATKAAWESEKQRHADEIAERNTEEKRGRQREQEEFDYDFEKKKRQARDQFEEEKLKLDRELETRREELNRREQEISSREAELEDLKARVEKFPEQLHQATAQALKEKSAQLEGEAKVRESILRKEFEGEQKVLETRIESLEKTIKDQAQLISRLSSSQDKAYQQVQDIAVKAVEGASNVKGLASQLSEVSRRKSEE